VLDSTGEALVRYRRHFGTIPVEITAGDDMAYNEPGQTSAVRFVETRVSGVQDTLEVAPASATIFRIAVR